MRGLAAIALLAAVAAADDIWERALSSDDPSVRFVAVTRIGNAGGLVSKALLDAVYDEDDRVARAAVDAIGRLGSWPEDVAPTLRRIAEARPLLGAIIARALDAAGEKPAPPWRPHPPDPKAVETLGPLVDDADISVRMPAIWALLPDPAADAIFVSMLKEPDVRRRRIAAQHFFDAKSLPALREALADKDRHVRAGLIRAISQLGPAAEPALPELLALLEEEDPALADDLSLAVVTGGGGAPDRVVPALLRELSSSRAACRSAACRALSRMGDAAAPAVPALIEASFDEDAQVRGDATGALRALGRTAKEAAPFLAEIADADPEGALARIALQAVGGATLPPPPDPPDLPALRAQLAGKDARAAALAAFTLGRVGASDAETLDMLGAALAHPVASVRRHAALALLRIGPPSAPVLGRAATGPARLAASSVLPKLAAAAPEAVLPVALTFVADEDPRVHGEAMRAIGVIGPAAAEAAAPLLLAVARVDDSAPAGTAMWALGRLHAAEAVPLLVETLARPMGNEARLMALMALAELGPAAEPALPVLLAEARRPDDSLFATVLDALVRMGSVGQVEVVRLIREQTGLNRNNAIALVMALDLKPAGLKEALEIATTDPLEDVRETALLSLYTLGPGARPDVSMLVAVAKAVPADRMRWSRLPETLAELATVAELIAMVRDEDTGARWIAWSALSRKKRGDFTDEEASQALPLLIDALGDPKVSRAAAASAGVVPLGSPDPVLLRFLVRDPASRTFDSYVAERLRVALHALGAATVPALTKALGDEDPRIRAGAALVLEGFGQAARPAVPMLCGAARDADGKAAMPFVRAILAAADLETIATLFADRSFPGRIDLGNALVAAEKDALPYLELLRRQDDPRVRGDTVALFPRCLGVPVDWILKATGDEDDEVARAALSQLGGDVPAEQALPVLVRAARDDALRTTAMRVLVGRGEDAVPSLSTLVHDESVVVRTAALEALGSSRAEAALGLITDSLKDGDANVRAAAAAAIGRLRPDAVGVVPALRALLADPEGRVRFAAATTLGKLHAEEAVPDLVKLLGDDDQSVRPAAAAALAAVGAKGAEALAPFLGHPDRRLRELVRAALKQAGVDAVPVVVPLLASDDATMRRDGARVLAGIGKPAVDALRGALHTKEATTRLEAAWALGTMKAAAAGAVGDLTAALGDKDPLVAGQAAWALGQIGPAATDALPALEKLRAAGKHGSIVTDAIRRIRGS